MTVYDYYIQTKDLSLFEEQLPRIYEVLSYFRNEAPNYQGLIGYDARYWLFLDWSDIEKEGASTLYNMWYLLVLRSLVLLLELSGKKEEAEIIAREGEEIQKALESLAFDYAAGLFCDGISNMGEQSRKHSVHSQTLAIILGLKQEYHDNMFAQRILPFLRGEKLDVPTPSAYWTSYVLDVAREKGYSNEALDFIKRMWSPMIPLSTCTEIFDLNDVDFSYSHAWSAHPVFHLMNILGGVVKDSAGWNTIKFKPNFPQDLDYVNVIYPSPYGLIESNWKRKDGDIAVSLKMPEGVTARIEIPGYECEVKKYFECIILTPFCLSEHASK